MKKALNYKRAKRIRRKLKKVNMNRFRLSVYRSLRNISAQIIDDKNGKTLISSSSFKEKTKNKNNKTDTSIHIAELLAKKALEKNISKIYFDRGSYKYHGRIKAFAETLRKNGLTF